MPITQYLINYFIFLPDLVESVYSRDNVDSVNGVTRMDSVNIMKNAGRINIGAETVFSKESVDPF